MSKEKTEVTNFMKFQIELQTLIYTAFNHGVTVGEITGALEVLKHSFLLDIMTGQLGKVADEKKTQLENIDIDEVKKSKWK